MVAILEIKHADQVNLKRTGSNPWEPQDTPRQYQMLFLLTFMAAESVICELEAVTDTCNGHILKVNKQTKTTV